MTSREQHIFKSIGIISLPMGQANIEPFNNLVTIVTNIADDSIVIATYQKGVDVKQFNCNHIFNICYELKSTILGKILTFIIIQLKICWSMLLNFRNVDLCLVYLGDALILPVLIGRILNIKLVLIMGSCIEIEIDFQKNYLLNINKLFKSINLRLFNKIIIYSPRLIETWKLSKFKDKIVINSEHIIDINKFHINKNINDRENLVGFIGRFSEEKGILNFVCAIEKVGKRDDTMFLIGGDGKLKKDVLDHVDGKFRNNVNYIGWIPHDELSIYLNKLKLLVIPSYSEGIPNIMLEAMSCGTPVLATSVGAVPDVICDNINGFILKDNSPECIAENITQVLKNENLESISRNARKSIEKRFALNMKIGKWKSTLNECLKVTQEITR